VTAAYTRPVVVETAERPATTINPRPSSILRVPLLWVAVGLILVTGAGLRLINAGDPMLEFFPTRQYMSVDLAWKYDMALGGEEGPGDHAAARILGETEPPVMEMTTAAVWRAIGDRPLWVPRLLTVLVWSAGGVALAFLLRRLTTSVTSVIVGVAAWTFIPFVVQATRVFQPDPLMVAAIVAALWALVVDDDRRTTKSLMIAGLLSGFAVFVKAPASFFVVPAFVGLAWYGRGFRALLGRRTVLYAALTFGAALVYNVLGLVVFGYLDGKQGLFIFPKLLLEGGFWSGWLSLLLVTFGVTLVGLALIGIGVSRGRSRVLGLSLIAGYVAYGLVFTWNYSTHHYYHLPFVIIVSLGVGLLAGEIEALVRRRNADLLSVSVVTVAAICLAGGWMFSLWRFVPPEPSAAAVDRNVRVSEEVGELLDHTDNALVLVEHYGYPLAYYGSVKGEPWPRIEDFSYQDARGLAAPTVEDRFDELAAESEAEFFVVVDFDEWARQPELQAFLASRFPVYAEGPGYLVFDLRTGVGTGG
jgi:hypothetical protein